MSRTDAEILRAVAVAFNVNSAALTSHAVVGRSPGRGPIHARYAAMRLLRDKGRTYGEIGLRLNRDHTTIIAGVRRADELLVADADFRARLAKAAKGDRLA